MVTASAKQKIRARQSPLAPSAALSHRQTVTYFIFLRQENHGS
jgi:hypothetical protein